MYFVCLHVCLCVERERKKLYNQEVDSYIKIVYLQN